MMSFGSGNSLSWAGEKRLSLMSIYESRETGVNSTSRSEFAFIMGPDTTSVSTIVEKLVQERLKLGIVKSAKAADPLIETPSLTDTEFGESISSEETIPSLTVCVDKFEEKLAKIQKHMILDGSEPEENPTNVIEPRFSESEEETDVDYKNPEKDIQMLLNRTRSFYTPNGFKDSRFDLKKLEVEREKMWLQMGQKDKYTKLLYEEALVPLHHIRIKGRVYDEDDSDLNISREDIVVKSLESIMGFIKPIEMPPERWDPGNLATDKHAPYWAYAPMGATDKTINIIRHIYKTLKDTDFHRQDPKMRRRTGRRMHRGEESESSEESVQSSSEPESSEEEPFLLKRKESIFLKRKIVEVVEEEEEIQPLEILEGRFNLQTGHELSISNLQKQFPDTPESSSTESENEDVETTSGISAVSRPESRLETVSNASTARNRFARNMVVKSSWIMADEIDKSTSEESIYDFRRHSRYEKAKPTINVPATVMSRGFPTIIQRPKWITLKRECLEKEGPDNSLVERYRCLCLKRGIPPLEIVARNIKKRSAIFNRMGRGPDDTIQTLVEVLGKATRTLDLTGVYMTKNDICHLGKSLHRLVKLEKLRLPRTQLTAEKLMIVLKNLSDCSVLCLLDLSYSSLRKTTNAMIKTLTEVPSLRTLNLRHSQLANDSFNGLSHLPATLHSLDLSWNKLNDETGLKTLGSSLVKKKSELRELRIGWNAITGVDSAKILADMGRNLKHLKFFDISYNGFSSPDETVYFNLMLMEAMKLKCFLISGNPLTLPASEALLKELMWPSKPALRLIDLGDTWVQKDVYQMCKSYKEMYNIETRLGRIKGNIDLTEMNMSDILLKRLHFLNTSKKKKKTLKDFGNIVMKLMEKEETTKIKAGRFKEFMLEHNFKVEDGLIDAITKSLQDRGRNIDLEAACSKYRKLFPEEIKEAKKKKPKRKKVGEDEEPIIELMETRLTKVKSRTNALFVKTLGTHSAFKR